MNWKVIIVIVLILFVVGMIVGNYNCSGNFCNTLTSFVNLITDIIKTVTTGLTTIVSWIGNLFK